ncbi:MAG: spermidine/putrescine ABC transporter substrate-binding protein [Bacilli bacterium]|nr:spermidine/putrescine ABC transporter substrate-binding protein [Bacilli bacterium]
MKKIWLLIVGLLLLTGCTNKEYESSINVLNWSSYIPDSVIRDFEKEYNIKVNYATYSSNEELLAKVSGVGEGTYDLIFPSDYMVEIMRNKGLIQKIDKNRLSNYGLIDSQFLELDYDIDNEYSIPFLASSVVLAVNTDIVKDKINSYNDLLNSDYKDSIVLIDDTRIVIGSALMALGYDMNSTNNYELDRAKEWLLDLKPNIKAFDSDSPKSFLISKEASIGLMWSAEAILAKRENPSIEIIVPKEGQTISIDNFAIMRGSKNVSSVYLFIDYILSSDVMEKIVMDYPYSSVNTITNRRIVLYNDMGAEYLKVQKSLSEAERVRNIGQSILLYDKIWASIK